jgi:O-methyltransferase
MLNQFKRGLTMIGRNLSKGSLVQIQAAVNYMRVGRWMADHKFEFERVPERTDVFARVAREVENRQVLYLEFGVAAGKSIRWWSAALRNPQSHLHGFDSFEGLPEESGPWAKGQFSSGGKPPAIDDSRVKFFKGWFDQTLPNYVLPAHEQLVVNLDADLYSSTIYVLRQLRPYLKVGTFVYFDEMNHVDHEPRAFDEFVAESGIQFEPIVADKTLAFVFFRVTRAPNV